MIMIMIGRGGIEIGPAQDPEEGLEIESGRVPDPNHVMTRSNCALLSL